MTGALDRLIARDVTLCEAMADEMDDYLKSSALFWEPNRHRPGGEDLPKLTFGGLLLAMRRLETVRDRLNPDQVEALTRASKQLKDQKSQWRHRYQTKLARDLRSRLDTWAWYLDDCEQQGESAMAHYPRQVETRAKIELLLDEASDVALKIEALRKRRFLLDGRLRAMFDPGEFCWLGELAPGFPSKRFWYLWGRPRKD